MNTSGFCTKSLPSSGNSDSGHSSTAPSPLTGLLVQSSKVPSRPVSPWQKNTSARPAMTWLMRSTSTISANSSDTTAAAPIAISSEVPWLPNASCAPIPASAPTSIRPSAPNARTPARSVRISPSAARAKGTAKSGVLPSQLAIISISFRLPERGGCGGG